MRFLIAAATAALLAAPASAELKAFKSWIADCDNTLNCVAMGLPVQDGDPVAYIVIEREGGPAAAAIATLVVYSDYGEGHVALSVMIDGKPFGGGPLAATEQDIYTRTKLDAAHSAAFIAAIVDAESVTLQGADSNQPPIPVSLAGSSAALRYLDAEQKRADTVTALVARGSKPASAVPAAPTAPVVTAQVMTATGTAPKPPAGLPAVDPDSCSPSGGERIVYDLGGGAQLWGVCVSAGAYNYTYAFYLASHGGEATALPPGSEGGDSLTLTNPYLSDDGRTLSSFAKGRGIGDCGGMEAFAWDGKALQRVLYESMDVCRGVSPEDWIVSYRAALK